MHFRTSPQRTLLIGPALVGGLFVLPAKLNLGKQTIVIAQYFGLDFFVCSCYQNLAEGHCFPILRLPVFDTTSPGMGGSTETASKARHGNFTPPRISPSCPHENGWTGVSLCTDGVVAKQLVPLFCGRMGTARRLHWPSLMQETCTGGFWRILQCRWAVRERISVPDVTGLARCFSRCGGEKNNPLTT